MTRPASGRDWPATLCDGAVALRPLRLRDAAAWAEVRVRNEAWLTPWESTPPGGPALPWAQRHTTAAFVAMLRRQRCEVRAGASYPYGIFVEGRLAGQVTVGNIVRGSLNGGYVGYWVDQAVAGRGVAPTAVALVVDHCFRLGGLHRVEANIRPENTASLRVVAKLGFVQEGLRRAYLNIDGAYRDHLCYVLLAEDVPEGVLARWHRVRAAGSPDRRTT